MIYTEVMDLIGDEFISHQGCQSKKHWLVVIDRWPKLVHELEPGQAYSFKKKITPGDMHNGYSYEQWQDIAVQVAAAMTLDELKPTEGGAI